MEKQALLLLVIVGGSLFFGALCFQLSPSDQPGHDVICSMFSHSWVYIGAGLSSLFMLALLGVLLLKDMTSVPEGFVFSLLRPPRVHS